MHDSAPQSSNMTLPPLVAAVRDFAQLHNLDRLTDPALDCILAKVSPADHPGMYAVVSEVLPRVPIYLHPNLFDTFSDALITHHTSVSYFDTNTPKTSQSTGARLTYILSLMEQAINEDSPTIFSESDHHHPSSSRGRGQTPVKSKLVPSRTPNPQTDVTQRKTGIGDPFDSMAKSPENEAPSVNLATKVDYLTPSTTKAQVGNKFFQWPVLPESGFVPSNETIEASYLDLAGVFPASIPVGVFPRQFGTSFFATQIDPTSKNVPKTVHEPCPNTHALALYSAGHIPRRDLPHVYVPSCRQWGLTERTALRHAVAKHANASNDFEEIAKLKHTISSWTLTAWENIAQTYSWQLGYRTGNQVRVQYLKQEAPWISAHEWTTHEDSLLQNKKHLDKLLKQRNGGWDTVSEACGNVHSSVDCLRRWRYLQDELVRKASRRRWKDSEDQKLRRIKLALGNRSWEEVALALGTLRSPQQCQLRHEKRLSCKTKLPSLDSR